MSSFDAFLNASDSGSDIDHDDTAFGHAEVLGNSRLKSETDSYREGDSKGSASWAATSDDETDRQSINLRSMESLEQISESEFSHVQSIDSDSLGSSLHSRASSAHTHSTHATHSDSDIPKLNVSDTNVHSIGSLTPSSSLALSDSHVSGTQGSQYVTTAAATDKVGTGPRRYSGSPIPMSYSLSDVDISQTSTASSHFNSPSRTPPSVSGDKNTRSSDSHRSHATTNSNYSDDFEISSNIEPERSFQSERDSTRVIESPSPSPKTPQKQRGGAVLTTESFAQTINESIPSLSDRLGKAAISRLVLKHGIEDDAIAKVLSHEEPAALVLNHLLQQQIEFTRHYVNANVRLAKVASESNPPQFRYTTLDQTREFIRQHTRPIITYDEALKEVHEECS